MAIFATAFGRHRLCNTRFLFLALADWNVAYTYLKQYIKIVVYNIVNTLVNVAKPDSFCGHVNTDINRLLGKLNMCVDRCKR